jgi:hypothetical protein
VDVENENVWMQRTKMCGCRERKCVDAENENVWMRRMKMCGCGE